MAIKRVTKKDYLRLRLVGAQMSNILYNLAQTKKISDYDAGRMKALVRQWDAADNLGEATNAAD